MKNKKFEVIDMAARAPNKKKIQESLELQLWKKGAKIECFQDLICDYMNLYDIKKALQKDIKTRGISYETTSASGYPIVKQNQSVKDLVAVGKQMLLILDKLGLTTGEIVPDSDEDEL
ncbi:MAG: P27 family phage terminase small subunit [Enterocloster sp.]|uniref:P27 family phage terminase small subunit n=1 Tax=Enterocloster sp. TaxID=2719315 RepID=UPI0039940FC8